MLVDSLGSIIAVHRATDLTRLCSWTDWSELSPSACGSSIIFMRRCLCMMCGLTYDHLFSSAKIEKRFFSIKILKFGTPKIFTVVVLKMEQFHFTMQYCVQNM